MASLSRNSGCMWRLYVVEFVARFMGFRSLNISLVLGI